MRINAYKLIRAWPAAAPAPRPVLPALLPPRHVRIQPPSSSVACPSSLSTMTTATRASPPCSELIFVYFRGWAMGARQLICRSLQFRRSDRLVYPIISFLPAPDIVVVVSLVLLTGRHSELDAGTRSQDSGQMPPVQAPSDVKNRSNAAALSAYLPTLSICLASA